MHGAGNNFEEAESVGSRDLQNWWRITVSGEDSLKWGFHVLRIGVDGLFRSIIEEGDLSVKGRRRKSLRRFVNGF